jgi:hypothetical protein
MLREHYLTFLVRALAARLLCHSQVHFPKHGISRAHPSAAGYVQIKSAGACLAEGEDWKGIEGVSSYQAKLGCPGIRRLLRGMWSDGLSLMGKYSLQGYNDGQIVIVRMQCPFYFMHGLDPKVCQRLSSLAQPQHSLAPWDGTDSSDLRKYIYVQRMYRTHPVKSLDIHGADGPSSNQN